MQFDRADQALKEVGQLALKAIAAAGSSRENLDQMEAVYERGLGRWRTDTGFVK